jgi:hypothetical protein
MTGAARNAGSAINLIAVRTSPGANLHFAPACKANGGGVFPG